MPPVSVVLSSANVPVVSSVEIVVPLTARFPATVTSLGRPTVMVWAFTEVSISFAVPATVSVCAVETVLGPFASASIPSVKSTAATSVST